MLSPNSLLSSHFSSSAKAAAAGKRCSCSNFTVLYCRLPPRPPTLPISVYLFIYLSATWEFPLAVVFYQRGAEDLVKRGQVCHGETIFQLVERM